MALAGTVDGKKISFTIEIEGGQKITFSGTVEGNKMSGHDGPRRRRLDRHPHMKSRTFMRCSASPQRWARRPAKRCWAP